MELIFKPCKIRVATFKIISSILKIDFKTWLINKINLANKSKIIL